MGYSLIKSFTNHAFLGGIRYPKFQLFLHIQGLEVTTRSAGLNRWRALQ